MTTSLVLKPTPPQSSLDRFVNLARQVAFDAEEGLRIANGLRKEELSSERHEVRLPNDILDRITEYLGYASEGLDPDLSLLRLLYSSVENVYRLGNLVTSQKDKGLEKVLSSSSPSRAYLVSIVNTTLRESIHCVNEGARNQTAFAGNVLEVTAGLTQFAAFPDDRNEGRVPDHLRALLTETFTLRETLAKVAGVDVSTSVALSSVVNTQEASQMADRIFERLMKHREDKDA